MSIAYLFLTVVAGGSFDLDAKRGHAVLADFAKCTVKYEHDLAKQFVLGRAVDDMSDEEFHRAFDPRCLGLWGVRFQATGLAMKAALAEELVRRDLHHWPKLNPSGLPSLRWSTPSTLTPGPTIRRIDPDLLERLRDRFALDGRVGHLGECVVRASPNGAVAVLNTKIDSQAEANALQGLAPQIVACVKAGEAPGFARNNLRYGLALSYYQLANATSVPGARQEGGNNNPRVPLAAAAPVSANTPENVAIQAVHNFGACVVSRTPQGARNVLALDFNSPDYEETMQRYIRGHDYCIPFNGRMSSSGLLFAGAVAEALIKTDVKSAELPQRLSFDPQRDVIAARSPTEAMALCTCSTRRRRPRRSSPPNPQRLRRSRR